MLSFVKIFLYIIYLYLYHFCQLPLKWGTFAMNIKTSDEFSSLAKDHHRQHDLGFSEIPREFIKREIIGNESHAKEDVGPASTFYHHLLKRQVGQQQQQQSFPNQAVEECLTPDGEQGTCQHITYCRIPELQQDIWRLVAHLCVIDRRNVGICCPQRFVNPNNQNLRIDNEATASGNSASSSDGNQSQQQQDQRGCGASTMQFADMSKARQVDINEWPWVTAIIRPGFVYVWCGGVLVTNRHVLTAAHCIHKFNRNDLLVRLGEYNTELLNETRARDIRISDMFVHVDYDPFTYQNDIGIIRLEQPALFNTYIWPICMPPIDEENWQQQVGIVAGWGSKNFGGPHSDVLMQVALPVWKLEDCRGAMLEHISDSMLCAGHPEGGQDSCQGDSGGPLMIQMPNRRWATIGIVSWGVRCGEPNRPGVYTRVDRYLPWIIEHSNY